MLISTVSIFPSKFLFWQNNSSTPNEMFTFFTKITCDAPIFVGLMPISHQSFNICGLVNLPFMLKICCRSENNCKTNFLQNDFLDFKICPIVPSGFKWNENLVLFSSQWLKTQENDNNILSMTWFALLILAGLVA